MRKTAKKAKIAKFIEIIVLAALTLFSFSAIAMSACVFNSLSDIPLDSKRQAAPGLLMFLIDDSGSMDFATMVEDKDYDGKNFSFTGGMFLPLNRDWAEPWDHGDGVAYVFDNPGDQSYSARDLEGEEHLYWQSQYHGINKMYYNPDSDYEPWPKWDNSSINDDLPGWSDPDSSTSVIDMDPDTPRSNPMDSSRTFDLNEDFYTFSSLTIDTQWVLDNAEVIVDNSEAGTTINEIIIDNCDSGFTINTAADTDSHGSGYDGGCGDVSWLPSNDASGEGTYTVTWETAVDDTAGFEVWAFWDSFEERGTDIPYTISHSGGEETIIVDQTSGGGSWQQLGTDTFTFDTGTASIKIDGYEVTSTGDGSNSNEVSMDAVKLVCVSDCSLDAAPFSSTGPESTASGWSSKTDGDVLDDNYTLDGECLYTDTAGDYTATWTADTLDPGTEYDVYTWWDDQSENSGSVTYKIYNNDSLLDSVDKDQSASNSADPQLLKSGVTFSSGTGKVVLEHTVDDTNTDRAVADAVAFVPTPDTDGMPSGIRRAHYFVQNSNGTYLVNMEGDSQNGDFGYYEVVDSDDDGKIDVPGGLVELTETEAQNAGIVTGRTYKEERVNFANWYSFYRKRELTAKNAIAKVVTDMQGVFIGLESINGDLGQPLLPVNVSHNGVDVDETDYLLDILYNNWNSGGGTPLRDGLDYVGEYFSGDHVPGSIYQIDNSDYTDSASYPYFPMDDGGTCEQAFTIAMTDGFWNGSYSGVGDADGDNNTDYDGGIYAGDASNTLADIAMHYYENDLNSTLDDDLSGNSTDSASHQHMVTYGVSFGANGTLDPDAYSCYDGGSTCSSAASCSEASPCSCCPEWPDPGNDDNPRKIDDLYHASVNGRGSFINAGNPEELIDAMDDLKSDIESRLGSAAAVATNTLQRQYGSRIYQGIYHTDGWTGDVRELNVNQSTGEIGSANWSASTQLDAADPVDRDIFTYDGSGGILFDSGNAGTIGLSADLVDYLRGDDANEGNSAGDFRQRSSKMGDVVHSAPVLNDGVVYVGANDGMLHAFDTADGQELFAYVPKIVVDEGYLDDYASQDYDHKYFVDNTAHVRETDSTTLLVGGLRKGGKGYFCLDVSDPANFAAGDVKWEYDATGDDDLGYSYSRAFIVETEAEGWVVVFGNGYDSVNEEAVLYVLAATDGSLVKKIKTGISGCNGLSTPAVADMDADGFVDFAYAGDLKGNLWKFDLRGADKSSWGVSYTDGTDPKPLIQVKNSQGGQPITVQPDIAGMNCDSEQDGYIVVFGTGRYLGDNDATNTDTQSFYGVWDWQANWSTGQEGKYLGVFDVSAAASGLSNSPASADDLTLLEQTATVTDAYGNPDGTGDWRLLSNEEIEYYEPTTGDSDSDTDHAGWYYNLPTSGGRVLRDPDVRKGTGEEQGIVTFISNAPDESPCSAGGTSWIYQVSLCDGGQASTAVWDINEDGVIDEEDEISYDPNRDYDGDGDVDNDDLAYFLGDVDYNSDGVVNEEDLAHKLGFDSTYDYDGDGDVDDDDFSAFINEAEYEIQSVSGKRFDQMLYEPVQLEDHLYINDSTGNINDEFIPFAGQGILWWRQIQ